VAAGTNTIYDRALASFEASLARHGESLVLASLTPANVERWLLDLRQGDIWT
jgi:hypothetical protein